MPEMWSYQPLQWEFKVARCGDVLCRYPYQLQTSGGSGLKNSPLWISGQPGPYVYTHFTCLLNLAQPEWLRLGPCWISALRHAHVVCLPDRWVRLPALTVWAQMFCFPCCSLLLLSPAEMFLEKKADWHFALGNKRCFHVCGWGWVDLRGNKAHWAHSKIIPFLPPLFIFFKEEIRKSIKAWKAQCSQS